MNGGAEAVETALKLARKWGYMKKKIPQYEGVIIACKGCFHGRTLAIISMSNDPSARDGFGPFIPGVVQVEYNNVESLKTALEQVRIGLLGRGSSSLARCRSNFLCFCSTEIACADS